MPDLATYLSPHNTYGKYLQQSPHDCSRWVESLSPCPCSCHCHVCALDHCVLISAHRAHIIQPYSHHITRLWSHYITIIYCFHCILISHNHHTLISVHRYKPPARAWPLSCAVSTQIYILYYLRDCMTDPEVSNNAKTYTAILCILSQVRVFSCKYVYMCVFQSCAHCPRYVCFHVSMFICECSCMCVCFFVCVCLFMYVPVHISDLAGYIYQIWRDTYIRFGGIHISDLAGYIYQIWRDTSVWDDFLCRCISLHV